MLIKNIKIITMTGRDIETGYVRFEDGIFTDVGSMNELAEKPSEEIIDGGFCTAIPGFIDSHCHIGMWSDGYGTLLEGDDGNESTDPSTPHMRAVDSINAMDRCFEDAVNAGVTCVCTGVGSANPIGGSFAILKTGGSKRVDKLIVKSPAAIKFALGENPKGTYDERDEMPITRMAVAAIIREQLSKARRYKEDMEDYERTRGTDDETSRPDFDAKCEALLPLFDEKNKLKAHFHCHRADDIFTAIRIAKEFSLDYVLIHCTEGALIADELAEDKPDVVLGPLFGDRCKPELAHHSITTPKALFDYGIRISICTDHPETEIQYLPLTAALAVRGGLSHDEALKSITINAAEILGISDRVGSIEPGKDADMALFSGDPLDILQTPDLVTISGKIMKNTIQ